MLENKKVCPVCMLGKMTTTKLLIDQMPSSCLKGDCEIYDRVYGQCAILSLATSFRGLLNMLSDFKKDDFRELLLALNRLQT